MKDLNCYKPLKDLVKEFLCFKIRKEDIFYSNCSVILSYSTKEDVSPIRRHLATVKHKRNSELRINQTTLNVPSYPEPAVRIFDEDLIKSFTNIPLNKLNNPIFNPIFHGKVYEKTN